ncbi:MAG: redoxin domain-containing protein [Gammaproteobacteria bacterium]|nr:redoxin domain-containing protein [Gammaproteobacteria bacterium]MXY31613.1 redoxin domain-containing protein [Gammaproteobacteria bacterium]MYC51625.1 redoxin domain-containing protein [Gammaproteobacteria bacterium]MYC99288.1 redoxin domain-containing protein [Gammaproteobacteria bacterium]MYF62383.1 redoxin domain-containing protein [Gammaproteobacteria bacterium]
MRRFAALFLLAGVLGLGAPAEADAQLLEVGEMAPDFELPGATRFGVLQDPVRLSDYRGETVVLAFFFRVRTRG